MKAPQRKLAAVFLALMSARVEAQCPNGTPPPCRSVTTSARRATPPLNAHAWIVVPFGNVTRSPELEWLRDASVNLLTLDLGRWTDITVVDDKRVGDLLRELPAARTSAPLTLSDGLALARRAGAGTLVMGDFYKLGNGARLAANVFDVKSGTRLRSVAGQAASQDSLLTAFGPIARGVLALPPPVGVKLGATGTTNVQAYQEYLLGSAALNRFEISASIEHLRKAIAMDSAFALAHYKLSLAFSWADDPDAEGERSHATSAARLAGSLPAREQALIAAHLAAASADDAAACGGLRRVVAQDSLDVEAMYGLGECEFNAVYGAPERVDSLRGRYRGNWNTALGLFRRVLRLDPTYHPAFAHILDALSTGRVVWCANISISCGNDAASWIAVTIRDADSLLMEPMAGGSNAQIARAESNRSHYLNLRAAQAIAREWVYAGPAEARAHLQLANLDLILGEMDDASAELAGIDARSDPFARRSALVARIKIAAARGRGSVGIALIDSLRREVPDASTLHRLLGAMPAAFGRLHLAADAIGDVAARDRWSAERTEYMQRVPRTLMGVPAEGLNEAERRYWQTLKTDSICAAGLSRCRTTALLPTMAYAVRIPRAWWPPYETPEIGFRFAPSRALARRDTPGLHAAFTELDSIAAVRLRTRGDDQATTVIATDAALALHDTVAALRLTRQFVDSLLPAITRITTNVSTFEGWAVLLAPRMMLMRADIAAAVGARDEARTWYLRLLDLWSGADAEMQPVVGRVRASLAALETR